MLEVKMSKKLRDFDLDVEINVRPGEVLALLGENGSGKSTVLNLLAGLLTPDEGEITLNGRILFSGADNRSIPPEERNIGYVFQNYALFPHMSAFENVAFGLKRRKIGAGEIQVLVSRMLEDRFIQPLHGLIETCIAVFGKGCTIVIANVANLAKVGA